MVGEGLRMAAGAINEAAKPDFSLHFRARQTRISSVTVKCGQVA